MKLPFCAVSKAYSKDSPASEGMRNYANAAHKSNLPVTWIIDLKGAKAMASQLADWHEEFGDEVALSLVGIPINGKAYAEHREAMRQICPWSEVTISGLGINKSGEMLAALEEAGIQGHWGYCWEQSFVDTVTDLGHPPGLFYASPASYKMPRPGGGGVVAVEWISRDLNKAFWTGDPVHFSPEPDALLLMGNWPEEECDAYVQHMIEQYLRNARTGQAIPFILQEEAEQLMEKPEVMAGFYSGEAWQRSLAWLEKTLASVAGHPEIEFTTLPDIVSRFRGGEWAFPRLYRAADRAWSPLRNRRSDSRVYKAEIQMPEVLHYCSENLFATFRAEGPSPVRFIRYDRQQPCGVSESLMDESRIPILQSLTKEDGRWHVVLSAEESTPFALCLPLNEGEKPPAGCPGNENSCAWEFQVEPGIHEYHSA